MAIETTMPVLGPCKTAVLHGPNEIRLTAGEIHASRE